MHDKFALSAGPMRPSNPWVARRYSSALFIVAKASLCRICCTSGASTHPSAFVAYQSSSSLILSPPSTRSSHTLPSWRHPSPFSSARPFSSTSKATTTTTSARAAAPRKKKEMADSEPPPVPHAPDSIVPSWFNVERTRLLTPNASTPRRPSSKKGGKECVVYWMQRDVRTVDNWALLFAQHQARELGVPLRVCYALPPPPPPLPSSTKSDSSDDGGSDDESNSSTTTCNLPPRVIDLPMTLRHGTFLLGGLRIVETELHAKHVPFDIIYPRNRSAVGQTLFAHATSAHSAVAVVTDFSPLRLARDWIEDQAAPLFDNAAVPVYSVDAHNVVPVWHASPKREVGARTLRPKINKLLPEFLTHFGEFGGNEHLLEEEYDLPELVEVDWTKCEKYLKLDESVPACDWATPGHAAAMKRFRQFCDSSSGNGLKNFDSSRNDPNFDDVCSNLSPWINYGQVSFQRLALDVRAFKKYADGRAAFIEEGIVRRELSDNFCYYARDVYDSLDAAAGWARDSLDLHETDEREYLYTLKEFDEAKTHDDLWNAAQLQLVRTGGMHGFLRMYWAKKILEWTTSAEVALRTGLYFNDRYALDGNDPNGFVGVGWSVMGIHDMGWKERPVFGKIRFMNYNGCKRKFKVAEFVAKHEGAAANALAAAKKHGGGAAAASAAAGSSSSKKAASKKTTATATAKKKATSSTKKKQAGGKKRKSPSS